MSTNEYSTANYLQQNLCNNEIRVLLIINLSTITSQHIAEHTSISRLKAHVSQYKFNGAINNEKYDSIIDT